MKHISFLHYFNLFLGNEPIFSKSFSISRIEIIGPSIRFYSKYLNIKYYFWNIQEKWKQLKNNEIYKP
jgi:hypothetical protein